MIIIGRIRNFTVCKFEKIASSDECEYNMEIKLEILWSLPNTQGARKGEWREVKPLPLF